MFFIFRCILEHSLCLCVYFPPNKVEGPWPGLLKFNYVELPIVLFLIVN